MLCHACDHPIEPSYQFCTKCGAAVQAPNPDTTVLPIPSRPSVTSREQRPVYSIPTVTMGDPVLGAQTAPARPADSTSLTPTPTSALASAEQPTLAVPVLPRIEPPTLPAPDISPAAETDAESATHAMPVTLAEPQTQGLPVTMADDHADEPDPTGAWARADLGWAESPLDAPAVSPAPTSPPAPPPNTAVMPTLPSPSPDALATSAVTTSGALPAAYTNNNSDQPGGFVLAAVTATGLLTVAVTIGALLNRVLTISSTVPLDNIDDNAPKSFRLGHWSVNELASNASIALLIAAVSIIIGAVVRGFKQRGGAGFCGGAGLAISGVSIIVLGLAERQVQAAIDFTRIPSETAFSLTVSRNLGYWLFLAAAVAGIVLFFASLNDAFGDRRPGLNPVLGAVGGLAVLGVAGGPLLPTSGATLADNWTLSTGADSVGQVLLYGRLVQLALILIAGLIGFLSVRRWGFGLAAGCLAPMIWLCFSTVAGFGPNPIGPGWANPGATPDAVHAITLAGVVGAALITVAGAVFRSGAGRR